MANAIRFSKPVLAPTIDFVFFAQNYLELQMPSVKVKSWQSY